MDPLAQSERAIAQVQTVQAMFGGGPMAAVAAFFAVAFFGLLWWYLWRGKSYQDHERVMVDAHRQEIAALNEARLKESMQVVAAINLLSVVQRDFASLVEETRRKNSASHRRRAGDKPFDSEASGAHRVEPPAQSKPPGDDGSVR